MSSSLDRILKQLEDADSTTTKVAAAAPATESTHDALLRTVKSLSEKTASTAEKSPVKDLQTMAKEAQEAEFDLLTKQSHFLGAALADGFMERFAQYDAALSQSGVKTAAALEPETVKAIAAEAYKQARVDFEKQASAEYEQGYQDQIQAIHKIASDLHYSGQMLASHVVNEARKAESR